jgi:hypothetical protein
MHLVSFANVLLLGENKTDYNKLLGSLTTGEKEVQMFKRPLNAMKLKQKEAEISLIQYSNRCIW